ncbi:hypothetical protein AC477_03085 [miscellaneous Crenarchaeota group-1 archaeon SG8-32-1]|uniref:Uncharacterized protein n=1 Tax=miscellaneous Crenarchaeota group-1 archaeon SG8-32-1 TaxID=1685124 RepID=A0A0M0BUS7_9ARCH|nr:MAG: hypothetical protein AC477_03085 [miscellaneous Crenarchaeota group-1 archaeon SG8-32-1]
MNPLQIYSKVNDTGVEISFQDIPYPIKYPTHVWEATPKDTQKALKDNLALATTMHLPLIFDSSKIIYHSGLPLLEPYFIQNFLKDIPSCTEIDGKCTDETVRKFFNTEYQFLDPNIVYPSNQTVDSSYRALVGTSFGKDSLLTYAVAQEIGLKPEMVYVIEQSMTYEQKHKTELAKRFKNEFGKELNILKHETGKFRDYTHLGVPFTELGWGLQTTEYALELIPFAYSLKSKYLLFGNEQTASSSYMDSEGRWTVHPCYDQSHRWTVHINQITQIFSGRSVNTGSLIEPLMDMMIQYILAHRYPEIAKYQMSCFTETDSGQNYHWCHNCSICAKMYLMCVGSGINPQQIGIKKNMLEPECKKFFTLFGGKSITMTYAHTKVGRDEQLFAFYLASKKEIKGGLVEEFKASPLYQEAKEREDELYKTFCSLHSSISVPKELRNAINSIYKEELGSFNS